MKKIIDCLHENKVELINDSYQDDTSDVSLIDKQIDSITVKYVRFIGQRIEFRNCTFTGDVIFDNCIFKCQTIFHNCIFNSKVTFKYVGFKKNFNVSLSTFGDVEFQSTFDQYANFYKIKANNVFFSTGKFLFECNFEKAIFNQLGFSAVGFEKTAIFRETDVNLLNLNSIIFSPLGLFDSIKVKKSDRETFSIIKNELLKQNNWSEALRYHVREMEAYKTELKYTWKFWKKEPWEKLMVTVNGYSNIHNTSWSRGLLSTLSISFVFFVLLQISIHKENIFNYKLNTGKILGEFINFINPTHSIDYFVRSNSGDFTLFIDLISRVFIGYCIYQTVQAFRIYGKNV